MNNSHNLPTSYFNHNRKDLFPLLPEKAENVLDIGCGTGALGSELKKQYPSADIWGVEKNSKAALLAEKVLERLFPGSFEEADFQGKTFDLILMGDIIEHTEDPQRFLKIARELLDPNGLLIASIPNIRNFKVLWRLVVHGRFEYQDEGILDRTHRWFFTRREIEELFHDTGYRVLVNEVEKFGKKALLAHRLSLGILDDFLTAKFYIRAKKR